MRDDEGVFKTDELKERKLLKDFPLHEWMEAADGCEFCKAKYQVQVTWVDETGSFGDVEYKILHKVDCPGKYEGYEDEPDEAFEFQTNTDVAGWEFMDQPFNLRGKLYYPLKSRANVGPCLKCGKLVIGVPLILFIDGGKGGELDFCFDCAQESGILEGAKS